MAVLTKYFFLGACPVSTVKNWIYAFIPKVDHVSIVTSTWSNWQGTSWYCTSCQDASAFSITLLMFAIAASDVNLTFRGKYWCFCLLYGALWWGQKKNGSNLVENERRTVRRFIVMLWLYRLTWKTCWKKCNVKHCKTVMAFFGKYTYGKKIYSHQIWCCAYSYLLLLFREYIHLRERTNASTGPWLDLWAARGCRKSVPVKFPC